MKNLISRWQWNSETIGGLLSFPITIAIAITLGEWWWLKILGVIFGISYSLFVMSLGLKPDQSIMGNA